MDMSRTVLVAPDAFKGTASAHAVAGAIARGAVSAGWLPETCPMSDGGEGFLDVLDVLGGELRTTTVTGPLGEPIEARWRLAGVTAVIESAQASGLVAAGGRDGNDPIRATTRGTGELIVEALRSGAERIVVGVGGSATTDGGIGALTEIDEAGGIGGTEILVACDVTVLFTQAAGMFGPQKGAGPREIEILFGRLQSLQSAYLERGVDVSSIPGSGAAGGLAGGLVVAGARIVSGIDLVSSLVGLDERIENADLVITGEGRLDPTSWEGKVVAGVARRALDHHVGVVVFAGQISPDAIGGKSIDLEHVVDLSAVFGSEASMKDPGGCCELASEVVLLSRLASI